MRSLFALTKKDLKGYFDQPTGYILIVVFVALASYWFFRSAFLTEEASLRPLFSTDFTIDRPSLPWLLALFVPAATMRLLAEEQRDGTLEILLTQPIRGWVVLLAKFMAGLIFVSAAILSTVGIPISLEVAGNLDEGAIIAQYLGCILLAAAFVSIGLFSSSLTRNQIVAFLLGISISALLMLVGMDQVAIALPDRLSALLQTLSPLTHFSTIARGVIDFRDILYFLALIFTFLSAAYLMIRSKSLSHQSPQYRNLQLGVAGLIVFSLLVGWFGNSIGGRLDLTEDKIFTMSAGTQDILSGLDDILTVELFESKNPPVQVSLISRDVTDFLEDFRAGSGGNVKLIHRFPEDDQDDLRKAQLAGVPPVQFNVQRQGELQIKTGYLGLALTYADRREVIPYIDAIDGFEYRIASMAYRLLQSDRKRVAFLTGHGENDLRSLAGALGQQYEVVGVKADEETPLDLNGVDVLIIAGPTERIPDGVREALHRYVQRGGKAMVLLDAVLIDEERLVALPNRHSFADFVERYAVLVENNLVFDLQSNETLPFSTQVGSVLLPYPYWARVSTVDKKVTGEVDVAILPWASSLGITEAEGGRVEVIPLLRTRATATVDYAYGDVSPNSPRLDVSLTQQFESDVGVAVTGKAEDGEGDFRLVIMGDSDWLTDGLAGIAPQNLALGLNLVDWLAQEDTLAAIRSKVISTRMLDFNSSAEKNVVQYANILGVPLAFVLMGMFRYVRRRNAGLRTYDREE